MSDEEPKAQDGNGDKAIDNLANEIGVEAAFLTFFFLAYQNVIGTPENEEKDLTVEEVEDFKTYLLGGKENWKKVCQGALRTFFNLQDSGVTFTMDDGSALSQSDFEEICARVKSWIERNGGETNYGGCYVATAVYGSYDCPQVWTLRRYRDSSLQSTPFGRAFVKTYYAVSPTLVRKLGQAAWFNRLFRFVLTRFVEKLNCKGIEDGAYYD